MVATDWTAQAQAEVDRWVEAQRAWWAQVSDASGSATPGGASGTDDAVRQAVDAWRTATHQVVDAQAQALLGALSRPAGHDAGELVRTWTDAQRKMWQDWIAAFGGTTPGATDSDPGGRLLESLREAAEHLVRSQGEWAKAWTSAEARSERPGGP
jgi:hypothetical protein